MKYQVFALIVVLSLLGCRDSATDTAQDVTTPVVKGITVTPKSAQASDYADFISRVKDTGSMLTWSGDWLELTSAGQNSPPWTMASQAVTYGYTPIVIVQVFNTTTGQLLRPLDLTNTNKYRSSAEAFVTLYKPAWFGIGIDVNILAEKSPSEFAAFVTLFADVRATIKAASPSTKVFTVFQLERLRGLKGGQYGGLNDPSTNAWSLLAQFPGADIIGFTTYPSMIYSAPSEIPGDYYYTVAASTGKPYAYTEIGWHSDSAPVGWESSTTEQAAFVTTFFKQLEFARPQFAVWCAMYDQNTTVPFNSMGLRSRIDGSTKPAWDQWLAGK